ATPVLSTLSLHDALPIWAAAHVLGAAGHGHVGVAEQDRLGRGEDGLQAAAAQPVERQRRHLDRQPALDARDARQVVVMCVGVDRSEEHTSELQSLAYLVC